MEQCEIHINFIHKVPKQYNYNYALAKDRYLFDINILTDPIIFFENNHVRYILIHHFKSRYKL